MGRIYITIYFLFILVNDDYQQRAVHLWLSCTDIQGAPKKNPSNIAGLKSALLSIWNDLPQEFIDKVILSF